MSPAPRSMSSLYLEWAELHSHAGYNLTTSGILNYPLQELPVAITDLEINGDNGYGNGQLVERIANNCGVPVRCVVTANGTAMANHLAMAALLKPGDDVLIEWPTHRPLLEVASYLGANVLRFDRRSENGFKIDINDIQKNLTSKTRLIVLTNPNNPTGVFTPDADLSKIGELAARVGATSSLTKAYGLSRLRCGWILAKPRIARQIWRLNDLFGAEAPHPTELLSVIAMDYLDKIRGRAMELSEANKLTLEGFCENRGDLEVTGYSCGTVAFQGSRAGELTIFANCFANDMRPASFPDTSSRCQTTSALVLVANPT